MKDVSIVASVIFMLVGCSKETNEEPKSQNSAAHRISSELAKKQQPQKSAKMAAQKLSAKELARKIKELDKHHGNGGSKILVNTIDGDITLATLCKVTNSKNYTCMSEKIRDKMEKNREVTRKLCVSAGIVRIQGNEEYKKVLAAVYACSKKSCKDHFSCVAKARKTKK